MEKNGKGLLGRLYKKEGTQYGSPEQKMHGGHPRFRAWLSGLSKGNMGGGGDPRGAGRGDPEFHSSTNSEPGLKFWERLQYA